MTPQMRTFLTEWLAWADSSAPKHDIFRNYDGLCIAADLYGGAKLVLELKKMFKDDRLNPYYPFGQDEYMYYSERCVMHKDLKHVTWVRSKVS